MALFSVPAVRVAGISTAVPKKEISNWDYDLISIDERKLLIQTTGVEKKRIVENGTTTSDLCFAAAEKLISELGWKKNEIEIVIFLSQSRDYFIPSTSTILQDRLGLSKNCITFDVGLGCSGFVYGMSVISGMMSASKLKKGLLMTGDISSVNCSKEDKSSYPLFGDAGAVTAVELDESAGPFYFNLKSDGAGYKSIIIPGGGMRNPATEESLQLKKLDEGITRSAIHLQLNGMDIFNFSVTQVPASVNEYFDFTKTAAKDFDYFIMHQANLLMNETIRKKLKFESGKVPYSLSKFGNTSSASVPVTLVSQLRKELQSQSLNFLIAGFGVGLSWGVMNLNTDKIICPEMIEV